MDKVKATVDQRVPIRLIEQDVEFISNTDNFIDAIYIPSTGKREYLLNIIETIYPFTRNIYLLFSDKKPEWLNIVQKEKIICIENFTILCHKKFVDFNSTNNPTLLVSDVYDIPSKRNFALTHAKNNNYKFIGLLDDDIIIEKLHLQKICAFKQTNLYDLLGFYILDFPDVSIIDHIERFIKNEPSKVSVSGNCLFINIDNSVGFFPYSYNEDWIFVFSNLINKKRIVALGFVKQLEHEPWNNEQRIRFEQFGDIIITGLISELHLLLCFNDDIEFWQKILENHINYLQDLFKESYGSFWESKLKIAIEQCQHIKAEDLSTFINNFNNEIKPKHYV